MADFPRAGAAGSVFGSIAEPFRDPWARAAAGPSSNVDDMLLQLHQLRALGIIDSATESDVEAAIISGDAGLILRWVNELATSETEAGYYGLDGEVRVLREGLAESIAHIIPTPAETAPGWGYADPTYPGDRAGPVVGGTAGNMLMAGTQAPVDPRRYYPGGVVDAPDGVFIRTNPGGTPIDPHDTTRLMIGVFTLDGRYGRLMPDGTVLPFGEETLTPYATAMGIPVVLDGVAPPDDEPWAAPTYQYLRDPSLNGAFMPRPDGGHMIVLNALDQPWVRDETMRHEIAHFITEAVAANPAAADAIAALRPGLDQLWNNYNTDTAAEIYGTDLNSDALDEEDQRYLDSERLADFFRIYMADPNIIYDNYRDLWRQIIPIVENLPEVRRYFQFAAADTGMMTG